MLLLNLNQALDVASVLNVVRRGKGNVFFLDRPGGFDKTFVYSVLLAAVRREGSVALVVASSEIAALLLHGGRTSHSAFRIPIDLNRESMCNISTNSNAAKLI